MDANPTAAAGLPLLKTAVASAPSGNLYEDMSTLLANVKTADAAKGTGLFTAERLITLEDAQQVQSDCSSVNPAG